MLLICLLVVPWAMRQGADVNCCVPRGLIPHSLTHLLSSLLVSKINDRFHLCTFTNPTMPWEEQTGKQAEKNLDQCICDTGTKMTMQVHCHPIHSIDLCNPYFVQHKRLVMILFVQKCMKAPVMILLLIKRAITQVNVFSWVSHVGHVVGVDVCHQHVYNVSSICHSVITVKWCLLVVCAAAVLCVFFTANAIDAAV